MNAESLGKGTISWYRKCSGLSNIDQSRLSGLGLHPGKQQKRRNATTEMQSGHPLAIG